MAGSAGIKEELSTETGETIIVAVQSDLAMKYVLTRPGRFPVRFLAPAGMVRPICGSGTGWALLASMTDLDVLRVVDNLNRSAAAGKKIDRARLLDLLAHVRRQGYAASYGTVIAGSGVIAIVLPGSERKLVLGVVGPVERLERNEAMIVGAMKPAIARCFASDR